MKSAEEEYSYLSVSADRRIREMFDIISKIKNRDKEAVAFLYERYGKKLYGYAVKKWKVSEDDSWELVYKTLYKVMQVSGKYSFADENKFIAFIFRIFINYLRNHYRDSKSKGIHTVELLQQHEKMNSDRKEHEEAEEKLSPLMKCMQKVLQMLDDWQRILLLMRAQDHPYENIAKYVDKPEEQLKVYHMRLKKVVAEKTNDCVRNKE